METENNAYIKYEFWSEWDNDMVIALLTNFPFNSFEETEDCVIAYLPSNIVDKDLKKELSEFSEKYKIEVKSEIMAYKNWNLEWESSYKPVKIDSFCLIKADFHDIDTSGFEHVIIVNPEMTFGTGHHETTAMMIRLMSEIRMTGLKVLDFGSGTGILAILADKMGAANVTAIDNDSVAVQNIYENARKNNCKEMELVQAETLNIKKYSKDIILANIDRNVLSVEAENISQSLHKGGILLLSGILTNDKLEIVELYERYSLKLMKSAEEGDWTALKFIAY